MEGAGPGEPGAAVLGVPGCAIRSLYFSIKCPTTRFAPDDSPEKASPAAELATPAAEPAAEPTAAAAEPAATAPWALSNSHCAHSQFFAKKPNSFLKVLELLP